MDGVEVLLSDEIPCFQCDPLPTTYVDDEGCHGQEAGGVYITTTGCDDDDLLYGHAELNHRGGLADDLKLQRWRLDL